MGRVYHLDLEPSMTSGARLALLPGDPARAEAIAGEIASVHGGEAERVASKREFTTCRASVGGAAVLVTSTGIGGPSTSIAVEELARLGVRTFVRVGTTGAIQDFIRDGDCVISTASVRLDGASAHYAPMEFPAVADFRVTGELVKGAEKAGVAHHLGVTASSDTFYPGEERNDSFRKYTLRSIRGATEEWRALGVLNYEMESATLFTMTSSMGLRGGCVTGVVNRGSTGRITEKTLREGTENVIKVVVASLEGLVELASID